jgi:thiamine-phosphate pyrophosphorylase
VLVDGRSGVDTFEELVSSLIEAGVDILQLRDKTLGDRELLDRARRLRNLTTSSETLFVMNDRPDLAVLSGADGIHVGQEELSVRDVRQIVGPRMLVGVSTHNLKQARQAVLDGASYLGVGPTFPSGTKAFTEFPGLEFARSVASEIRLPAFAIGGIGAANIGEVLATGMERVAVSGAVVAAENPAHAARCLLDRLKASP